MNVKLKLSKEQSFELFFELEVPSPAFAGDKKIKKATNIEANYGYHEKDEAKTK